MAPQQARPYLQKLNDELFIDSDVRRIFVRGYNFLLKNRELLDPYDHDAQDAIERDVYRDARGAFDDAMILAATQMDAAQLRDMAVIPDPIVERLRQTISAFAARVDRALVFPVVLALLHSIESACEAIIRVTQPRIDSGDGVSLIALDRGFAFPKPRFPLGLEKATSKELPPSYGLTLEYLELERYFSFFAVPIQAPPHSITPALCATAAVETFADTPTRLTFGAVSIFADKDDVAWEWDDHRFWATKVSDARKLAVHKRLQWSLQVLRDEKVHAFVAPELNIDIEGEVLLRSFWATRKRKDHQPELGVVGLLHRPEDEGSDSYVNRPLVLTSGGVVRWPYWKLDRFVFDRWPDKRRRTEALGRPPEHVVSIDTRLGRVCVLMCKDFLHEGIRSAVIAARPTLIIVPAMTNAGSVAKFREAAATMATTCHALTIFCNSSIHLRGPDEAEEPLGFIHLGTRSSVRDLPQHMVPEESVAVVATYQIPDLAQLRLGRRVAIKVFWTVDGVNTESKLLPL